MEKPVLFLDLDRTMFDTDQLYVFWGIDPERRAPYMQATVEGKIPEPDWANMVYPETKSFLERAKERYHLVLLTRTLNISFQKMKFVRSGLSKFFDGALYTTAFRAKGSLVKRYLELYGGDRSHAVFIDDEPANIDDVKRALPGIFAIHMCRSGDQSERVIPEEYIRADVVAEDFSEVAWYLRMYAPHPIYSAKNKNHGS
jgi:FMN phosphatase YigB (HAD superfamily)